MHNLGIRIEESLTSEIWSAQFSGQYIEELTQKTGNYKSLELFVRCVFTFLYSHSLAQHPCILHAQFLAPVFPSWFWILFVGRCAAKSLRRQSLPMYGCSGSIHDNTPCVR